MKHIICLSILLLLIAGASFADDSIKDLCDTHVCLVSFDFGYNFGFGGGSIGGSPSAGDNLLLEIGDNLLLEIGDYLLMD